MNQPIKSKPNSLAIVVGKNGKKVNWPAYRANNDRFLCTVPYRTGDPTEDSQRVTRLSITHQPSGLAATFSVPYRLALIAADAYFVLVGDYETEKEVVTAFTKLPADIKRWLLSPSTQIPQKVQEAVNTLKRKLASKPRFSTTTPVRPPLAMATTQESSGPRVLVKPPVSASSYTPKPRSDASSVSMDEVLKKLHLGLAMVTSECSDLAKRTSSECGIRTNRPTLLN